MHYRGVKQRRLIYDARQQLTPIELVSLRIVTHLCLRVLARLVSFDNLRERLVSVRCHRAVLKPLL